MTKSSQPAWVRRFLKIFLIVIAALLAVIIFFCAFMVISLSGNTENLKRIDVDGYLYSVDYTGNYYHNPACKFATAILGSIGCSSFVSHSETGDVISCRNYDLPHTDDDGNPTGLNVVVKLSPEGKYKSINIADAAWISLLGFDYHAGRLEDSAGFPLGLLPYLCMDGMNEKGLVCSILAVDVKEGKSAVHQDNPELDTVMISELLRYTLDSCASVDEAVKLAETYNMHGLLGFDYHLMVSDVSGKSIVLEWVDNKLNVVDSDAATNFLLSSDDAQDNYYKGRLREIYPGPADTTKKYHYGYGHGYGRFNTIVAALDNRSFISESEARDLLAEVSQEYVKGEMTSLTQYSAIYNSTRLTLKLWAARNYSKEYNFEL